MRPARLAGCTTEKKRTPWASLLNHGSSKSPIWSNLFVVLEHEIAVIRGSQTKRRSFCAAQRITNIESFRIVRTSCPECKSAAAALARLARPRYKTLNSSALMACLRPAGAARALAARRGRRAAPGPRWRRARARRAAAAAISAIVGLPKNCVHRNATAAPRSRCAATSWAPRACPTPALAPHTPKHPTQHPLPLAFRSTLTEHAPHRS